MSVEKEVRKARRALVFWRLVGDVIGVPRLLFQAFDHIFRMFERTIFYYELDAARRYRALTGADLAIALGEQGRYVGLDQESADAVHDRYRDQLSEGNGE